MPWLTRGIVGATLGMALFGGADPASALPGVAPSDQRAPALLVPVGDGGPPYNPYTKPALKSFGSTSKGSASTATQGSQAGRVGLQPLPPGAVGGSAPPGVSPYPPGYSANYPSAPGGYQPRPPSTGGQQPPPSTGVQPPIVGPAPGVRHPVPPGLQPLPGSGAGGAAPPSCTAATTAGGCGGGYPGGVFPPGGPPRNGVGVLPPGTLPPGPPSAQPPGPPPGPPSAQPPGPPPGPPSAQPPGPPPGPPSAQPPGGGQPGGGQTTVIVREGAPTFGFGVVVGAPSVEYVPQPVPVYPYPPGYAPAPGVAPADAASAAPPVVNPFDQAIARLTRLGELRRQDLITKDDYQRQRQAVLASLDAGQVSRGIGIEQGLRQLKAMNEGGLLSAKEYDEKRKEFVVYL